MLKENQQTVAQQQNTFVLTFLNAVRFGEPKNFPEMHKFFTKAFVFLTEHEEFDDPEFRSEWATHLNYLDAFSIAFPKELSETQIDDALMDAMAILEKRKEVKNDR
jgi:hypothetical protein